jgi:hypothetical protein
MAGIVIVGIVGSGCCCCCGGVGVVLWQWCGGTGDVAAGRAVHRPFYGYGRMIDG